MADLIKSRVALAQYFSNEFLYGKTVEGVDDLGQPVSARIKFSDGSNQTVNGLIASKILEMEVSHR